MRYEDIERNMYQASRQCKGRGSRKQIACILPWIFQDKAYYAGILRTAPLTGTGKPRYSYIIIGRDGRERAELSSALPPLERCARAVSEYMGSDRAREACMQEMMCRFAGSGTLDTWCRETFWHFIGEIPEDTREFFHFFYRSCIRSDEEGDTDAEDEPDHILSRASSI